MELGLTTVSASGDRAVVAISGDIDLFSAPALQEHCVGLIRTGHHHLILDFGGVQFIDSTGIGALVRVLKWARVHEGSVRLVCTHGQTIKLFRMTLLPRDFPTHDSVEEAARAAG